MPYYYTFEFLFCQQKTEVFNMFIWFTYDNVLVYHKRKCPECGIIILL